MAIIVTTFHVSECRFSRTFSREQVKYFVVFFCVCAALWRSSTCSKKSVRLKGEKVKNLFFFLLIGWILVDLVAPKLIHLVIVDRSSDLFS